MIRKKTSAYSRRRNAVRGVSEFDKEMVVESFLEAPPAEHAKWERAVVKRGRPRRGSGATVISVSVERGLLQRADLMAQRLGITRSELIARGLRAALAASGAA